MVTDLVTVDGNKLRSLATGLGLVPPSQGTPIEDERKNRA
jgi:hypothetical protein